MYNKLKLRTCVDLKNIRWNNQPNIFLDSISRSGEQILKESSRNSGISADFSSWKLQHYSTSRYLGDLGEKLTTRGDGFFSDVNQGV